jgi:flagellar hook assembly protein FlgD
MENPQDITTLDLWSFRLKNLTEQRGGVSILNNVINATYGEKAVVKVNVPQDSNVDVIVMTLDGNIVTFLQHGAISSGEHYFTWNGTNMSGTKVARGLYFVRVIGPNFDETRKVMVVKD